MKNYFNQRRIIQALMLVHSNTKNYVCEGCGKRPQTKTKNNLERHVFTHNKEKPFVCQYCKKLISRSDSLAELLYIHIEDYPYICEHCPKMLKLQTNLRKHSYIMSQNLLFVVHVERDLLARGMSDNIAKLTNKLVSKIAR